MDAFNNIDEAGKLLTDIYNTIEAKRQITHCIDYSSLEYFSCSIFNAMFNYNLVNLNEENENSPYIDLIDEANRIGVQVTAENPTTKKLEKSVQAFDSYKIDRLIVFFFSTSKANRIKSTRGEEIWTLPKIHEYLKKKPDINARIIKELKIWSGGSNILPSEIIPNINKNTTELISEMEKLKKYDPSLLVNDCEDENKSMLFLGTDYCRFVFNSYKNMFFDSQLGKFLCDHDDDEEKPFNFYKYSDGFFQTTSNLLEERKKAIFRKYYESDENKKKKDYFQLSNNYTYSIFNEIISSSQAANSSLLSIVRSAGQGKTVFCCSLASILISSGLSCFFITPVLHSETNPYSEFKKQVERVRLSGNYSENLEVIVKCMKTFRRPLVVIIDALNEYSNTKMAINGIADIVRDIHAFEFEPKIIISSRNKKYDEFESNLHSISKNIFCLNSSFIDNTKVKDAFFEKYEINNNIDIKNNYFLDGLFRQSRLFIKIFCEIYKNKNSSFDKYDFLELFDDYFLKRAQMDVNDNLFKDQEEFFRTIHLIGNWMMQNKEFNSVPLIYFEESERNNIKKLADNDIFTISTNENLNYVKFVFDEYRDYFLLDFFKNKNSKVIDEFFDSCNTNLDGLNRNIVLYRRKNGFDKKEDLKYKWYFWGSIDVILNLPINSLDEIDEKAILKAINKFNYQKDTYSLIVERLVNMFLNPLNCSMIFTPKKLISLKQKGIKNLHLVFSNKFFVKSLLDLMSNSNLKLTFATELLDLFISVNLDLNSSERDVIKIIFYKKFNATSDDDLILAGFTKEEVAYLGAKV